MLVVVLKESLELLLTVFLTIKLSRGKVTLGRIFFEGYIIHLFRMFRVYSYNQRSKSMHLPISYLQELVLAKINLSGFSGIP